PPPRFIPVPQGNRRTPSNDTIRPILARYLILPAATEIENWEQGWNRFGCKRFFSLPHAHRRNSNGLLLQNFHATEMAV
ncbi:MAG: hypothetical protein ACREDU_01245, partial [Methylocella sp.]